MDLSFLTVHYPHAQRNPRGCCFAGEGVEVSPARFQLLRRAAEVVVYYFGSHESALPLFNFPSPEKGFALQRERLISPPRGGQTLRPRAKARTPARTIQAPRRANARPPQNAASLPLRRRNKAPPASAPITPRAWSA